MRRRTPPKPWPAWVDALVLLVVMLACGIVWGEYPP